MSSPVSSRQRDIGEVARLRAEGVDRQPQSGFVQLRVERPADWETYSYAQLNHKLSTLNRFRTPPPAAPPLSALCAAEENIATFPLPTAHNYTPTENTRISAHLAEDNIATLHFNR